MDPSQFFGALLGTYLAAMSGAHAQFRPGECDPAGRCNPWYDDRRIVVAPQHRFYSPPQYYPAPPPPPPQQQGEEGAKVKSAIYEFCFRHPEEKFCGMLEAYLEHHPDAR